MKRSLVSFAVVVAAMLLCGPAWAVSYTYDFDGLTADAMLHDQDGWAATKDIRIGAIDVETEATAKASYTEAEQLRWTGFSGNVAKRGGSNDESAHMRYEAAGFGIPSDAPEARLSYTVFARGGTYFGQEIGFGWENDLGSDLMFRLNINASTNQWRLRDHLGDSTYAAGSGNAVLTSTRTSYRLTAVLDFTQYDAAVDPKITADVLAENLSDGGGEVEVMSDIDLHLTSAELAAFDPADMNAIYLRPSDYASIDNPTVTAGEVGPPIPGDANLDDIVNDADASILAAHWQQTGMEWGDGDFNADNIVNDADASILAAHWQESQEGTSPVPEPSTIVLLAFAAVSLLVWRRK